MIITISGLAGSGKSTIAKLLSEKIKYKYVSVGNIFRECAKKKHLSLEDFLKQVEENPETDKEIDKKIFENAKKDNIIIEGRLIGIFAKKNDIDSLRVWLNTDEKTRINRIAKRDNIYYDEALKNVKMREVSDSYRYKKIYDVDINDLSYYSLIIDTTALTPEQIINVIIDKWNEYNVSSSNKNR